MSKWYFFICVATGCASVQAPPTALAGGFEGKVTLTNGEALAYAVRPEADACGGHTAGRLTWGAAAVDIQGTRPGMEIARVHPLPAKGEAHSDLLVVELADCVSGTGEALVYASVKGESKPLLVFLHPLAAGEPNNDAIGFRDGKFWAEALTSSLCLESDPENPRVELHRDAYEFQSAQAQFVRSGERETIGDAVCSAGVDAAVLAGVGLWPEDTHFRVEISEEAAQKMCPGAHATELVVPSCTNRPDEISATLVNTQWGDGRWDLEVVGRDDQSCDEDPAAQRYLYTCMGAGDKAAISLAFPGGTAATFEYPGDGSVVIEENPRDVCFSENTYAPTQDVHRVTLQRKGDAFVESGRTVVQRFDCSTLGD